jgi:small redox-active disulfide protein 2
MKIKVVGPGCARCQDLGKRVREVVKEIGIYAEVEEVKDIKKIIEYSILTTPGLIINEKIICSGRVPSKAEVTTYITSELANEGEAKKE